VARGLDQNRSKTRCSRSRWGLWRGGAKWAAGADRDAQIDPRFSMRQSVRLLGLRSILCVPLKVQQQILGTVYVDNRIQAGISPRETWNY